ncbi:hypothetical protein MOBT1_001097 [Malassezia obtusa]|uniref:WD40 repeat-like protein n=1 Tax=Malassezia obtusa TaxID=76774 RepID=A0AAF0DZH7_9BASI|nr:hypothetical protein MOBT1_001097 [Malassezia obtusa]
MARSTDGQATVLAADVPVYALGFADAKHLFYVGGGGSGRSGVSNHIVRAPLTQKSAELQLGHGATLRAAGDLKLAPGEDAPMCLAVHPRDAALVCGVNEEPARLAQGNNHLRTYTYEVSTRPAARAEAAAELEVAIRATRALPSLRIRDAEHYQKTACFSPDGSLLAVGSSNGEVQLHRYPSMEPVWTHPYVLARGEEVYDTDFSHDGTQLVCATAAQLVVLSTAPRTSEEQGSLVAAARELQRIDRVFVGSQHGAFRAARFGRGKTDVGSRDRLFALVNAAPSRAAKTRASYVVAWEADSWRLLGSRKVSSRPGTVLSVSPNGRLLAAGTSDLCISVLQARTLRSLLRADKVHDFPPTCLSFTPSSRAIVSGSADSTVRLQVLPSGLVPKLSISDEILFVVFLVFAVLLGVLVLHVWD